MKNTLCVDEAATVARVSRRTIYYWLKAGKLEYVRTAGGSLRILTSSVLKDGNVSATVVTEESVA